MLYSIQKTVTIRKEPRIVNWPSNAQGMLAAGDSRDVLEQVTTQDGSTWGRISEFDANGKALWFCIVNTNTRFAVPTPPKIEINYPPSKTGQTLTVMIDDEVVFSTTL